MDWFDKDCSILITGGAGFLGRGILRRIEQAKSPARVTVYSRDEHKHYLLRKRFPNVRTVLGDVTDFERLVTVMGGHDVVIHAAALKHIPEAERDPAEAIRVNVQGSLNVARAATVARGVKVVCGISTDKVCSPRNTYGATKMLMERAFQESQRYAPDMHFCSVRYGNVVSSTGSVIPLFRDQIANNSEVSITSLAMTRFWISIDDAVALISKAINDNRRGMTYVAQCPSLEITNVAQVVWEMAGKVGQVPMRVIGTRPGEKLHETLVADYEAPYAIQDGEYILIPPASSLAGEGTHEVMPYESSHPLRWLRRDEMAALIKDSELV